jgi:sulfur carrier protein
MELIVNGKAMKVFCATVRDLLIELGLDTTAVVVERNREMVLKKMQESTCLCNGDRIEIVHIVGGG